jgi:tetratricopeptide (TPR) repeat protein
VRNLLRFAWLLAFICGSVGLVEGSSLDATPQSGIQALKVNDFARAERIFLEVVQKDPTGANFACLAVAESGLGHLENAIAHFHRSLELGNDSASVHYYLGVTHLKKHDPRDGIRELKIAIAKDAKLEGARSALGVALVNAGKPREAIPHLERARVASPNDAQIWASLVRAEFESGDAKQAIRTVDAATEAIPENSRLAATLASLCLRHRMPQKARLLLESASETSPQDTTLKLLLAEASLRAGEPVEVLAVLKGLPSEGGAPGELAYLRGTAYLLAGKLEEARPYLSAALSADSANVNYLFAYAGLQGSELHYADALATLQRAGQLAPRSEAILYQMAVTDALMGRYEESATVCGEALSLSSQPDEEYFLMGITKLAQRDIAGAAKDFRKALTHRPGVAAYHAALGVAQFEAGVPEESRQELDRALALDPQMAPSYLWRARLWKRKGRSDKARADLETYVALNPNSASAYQELSHIYQAEGESAKASAAQARYQSVKAQKNENEDDASFLDQLWLARIREGLGQVTESP